MNKKNTDNQGSKGYEIERDRKDDIMVSIRHINCCDTHYHKQIEIILSHSDRTTVEIDQVPLHLKKGDILVSHSYCLHKYNTYCLTSVICVPIKYTTMFNNLQSAGNAYTLIHASRHSHNIFNAMKKLKGFEKKNIYKQDSLFLFLMGELSEAQNGKKSDAKKASGNDITYKIIEYINTNYSENINLESLAEHCGYSKNYLSTVFNTAFKCNFKEYLNMRRLQAFIERQSLNDNESITDSASAVGFNSPRTFFNAFKMHYKMTPKEYLSLKKTINKEYLS